MKILNYEMVNVSNTEVPALEKRVRELIALGWETFGSPSFGGAAGTRLFQGMVLPDPVGRKSCRWVPPTATEPGRWEPLKVPTGPDA
jgi:hypothetical protein